jgi:hypothetical protein
MQPTDGTEDFITAMLVREIPGAPPELIANASTAFMRIVANERRRARKVFAGEITTRLRRAGQNALADELWSMADETQEQCA